MYNYQGYGMRKKKSWPFLLVTFLIAAIGSYFVQTYLTVITGGEEVKRLSNEIQYSNNYVELSANFKYEEGTLNLLININSLGTNNLSLSSK